MRSFWDFGARRIGSFDKPETWEEPRRHVFRWIGLIYCENLNAIEWKGRHVKILGINDGHNSSAALVVDGRVVAAVQEERLTRVKNATGCPRNAVTEVLSLASCAPSDIDRVALAGRHGGQILDRDPDLSPRDWLLRLHAHHADGPAIDARQLLAETVPKQIFERIRGEPVRRARSLEICSLGFRASTVEFVDHHACHAAAAYYGWGKFDEPVLVLTNDGVGDDLCATVNIGEGGKVARIASTAGQNSVAQVYAITTFLLGMVPLEHEYKLMGLAPYAPRDSSKALAESLSTLVGFDLTRGLSWRRSSGVPPLYRAHKYLERLFRRQRFDVVCGGLQSFTEKFLVDWVRNCVKATGIRKVALAGGIFLNVKANQAILELPEVDDLFVFPSAGDETNAIGAALHASATRLGGIEVGQAIEGIRNVYWGRSFDADEIDRAICAYPFKHNVKTTTLSSIEPELARLIAGGDVVARFKGPMEFGARALGNRSILANAGNSSAVPIINHMIKQRDFWMPFAPSILTDMMTTYLVRRKPVPAPYMVLSFDSQTSRRPSLVAATHPYDHTARPHEVFADQNPTYHHLLRAYRDLTGEGAILNTSFNLHGEPLVYSPRDALRTFDDSGLKHLGLGNFLLSKRD